MFFIVLFYTYCYCPSNISLEAISTLIVRSIIYEFSKQVWICSFTEIIICYYFSVLKVVFNRVIMFLISDLNDITYKVNKVIKYLQRWKCAKKMSRLKFWATCDMLFSLWDVLFFCMTNNEHELTFRMTFFCLSEHFS